MKALIVGQSARSLKEMLKLFVDADFETTGRLSGGHLLDLITKESFDFICMDISEKDYTTITLARDTRKLGEQFEHIPIIALTTNTDHTLLNTALINGITTVFNKNDLASFKAYLRHLAWKRETEDEKVTGRVLYIEDCNTIAKLVCGILESNTISVDHFTTAEAGLEAFQRSCYDMVLTDLLLDDQMSGYTVVSSIRANPENDSIPIVVISGLDQPSRRVDLLKCGANDFVAKPITGEELLVRVRNQLRTRRLLARVNQQTAYLKDLAMRDQLTELYNRHFLMEVGPKQIAEAKKNQTPLSMMVIDLDNFKKINDEHGHSVGDVVLESVAKLLVSYCEEQEVAFRFGGEEFVLILSDCDAETAEEKAEALRIAVSELKPKDLTITVSIGVSELNLDREEAMADIFQRADKAVYISKSRGRNRTTVSTQ